MKTTVQEWDFVDAFRRSDTYKDNFTHAGLRALYEYLTQYEDDTGEEMELDVVAICCEFSEYESFEEAYTEHYGDDSDLPEDERRTEVDQWREYFEDNTTVIEFDGGVIIQDF